MLQDIDCVILIFVIDVIFVVEIILDRLKDAAKATFELSPGGVAKRQDAITTTEVVMAAAISPLSFLPSFLHSCHLLQGQSSVCMSQVLCLFR